MAPRSQESEGQQTQRPLSPYLFPLPTKAEQKAIRKSRIPCCCCYLVTKLAPALCNPMDYSPSGSSVHGILQVRILEWVATSASMGFFWPRGRTCISCIGRQILYHWATCKALKDPYLIPVLLVLGWATGNQLGWLGLLPPPPQPAELRQL